MLDDQQLCARKAVLPLANGVGNGFVHNALPSAFDAVLPPSAKLFKSYNGFEFQPTEDCPKNFLIFDQTETRSQVMFHPAVAHKLDCHGLNVRATCIQHNFENDNPINEERETSSSLKEDSDDIDALLSFDEEEKEDNDDEVSTAWTYGNYGSKSPDACSTACSNPRKIRMSSSLQKPIASSSSSCNSERKRLKMKRMMKTLQGIVPGGNQMNTVAVLDEAVRYLKSLKVEAQKLGVNMQ